MSGNLETGLESANNVKHLLSFSYVDDRNRPSYWRMRFNDRFIRTFSGKEKWDTVKGAKCALKSHIKCVHCYIYKRNCSKEELNKFYQNCLKHVTFVEYIDYLGNL